MGSRRRRRRAVVKLGGTDVAYWVNALTFVVSALLVLGIRRSLEETWTTGSRGAATRPRYAKGSTSWVTRARLTIVVAWSVATVAQAIGNVSEIFLARDVFGVGASASACS